MEELTADSIIITTPVHIIYEVRYEPPPHTKHTLWGLLYGPSTTFFIQSKTRFWETEGIVSCFTKPNMPFGQLHYPSNREGENKSSSSAIGTWGNEALMFGSHSHQNAIAQATRQVSQIYTKILIQKLEWSKLGTGEAISWTTGWIQGALESGLIIRATCQFYICNENSYILTDQTQSTELHVLRDKHNII